MQVGMTEDQGLYNKPSAAVHPGGISRRDPTTIQSSHQGNIQFRIRAGRMPGTGNSINW